MVEKEGVSIVYIILHANIITVEMEWERDDMTRSPPWRLCSDFVSPDIGGEWELSSAPLSSKFRSLPMVTS
jgi:hypothetical protein